MNLATIEFEEQLFTEGDYTSQHPDVIRCREWLAQRSYGRPGYNLFVEVRGGYPGIVLEALVPDSTQVEEGPVIIRTERYLQNRYEDRMPKTQAEFDEQLRAMIQGFEYHEVDEWLKDAATGKPINDPHAPGYFEKYPEAKTSWGWGNKQCVTSEWRLLPIT